MNFDLTWKQALQRLPEWSYLMSQSQHSPVIPSLSQPPICRVTGDATLPAKNLVQVVCVSRVNGPTEAFSDFMPFPSIKGQKALKWP